MHFYGTHHCYIRTRTPEEEKLSLRKLIATYSRYIIVIHTHQCGPHEQVIVAVELGHTELKCLQPSSHYHRLHLATSEVTDHSQVVLVHSLV